MWFLSLFFTYTTALASAPAVERIALPALSVTWDSQMTPSYFGLEGRQGKAIKKQSSVSLKRVKFIGQKLTLLFIPKSKNLAPIRIQVPDTLNAFHVSKELAVPIDKNDIWLWGNTNQSKCGGDSSFSMRFLSKKGMYKSFSGLFAWKIKKDQLPIDTAFYILPSLSIDMPSSIVSDRFAKANKVHIARCEVHTGGECPYVFKLRSPEQGIKSRVKFFGNTNSIDDFSCPI